MKVNSYIVSVTYPTTEQASANIAAATPEDAAAGAIDLFDAYGFSDVEVTAVETAADYANKSSVSIN